MSEILLKRGVAYVKDMDVKALGVGQGGGHGLEGLLGLHQVLFSRYSCRDSM